MPRNRPPRRRPAAASRAVALARCGEVESLTAAESSGVGIRVITDHRQGFAHAGTLDEAVIAEVLDDLTTTDAHPLVAAAMAHLNLVLVHPFSDGNGRMARCLQTFVLARDGLLAPEFSSIEEYLGRNTSAYYAVLAEAQRRGEDQIGRASCRERGSVLV